MKTNWNIKIRNKGHIQHILKLIGEVNIDILSLAKTWHNDADSISLGHSLSLSVINTARKCQKMDKHDLSMNLGRKALMARSNTHCNKSWTFTSIVQVSPLLCNLRQASIYPDHIWPQSPGHWSAGVPQDCPQTTAVHSVLRRCWKTDQGLRHTPTQWLPDLHTGNAYRHISSEG